MGDQCNEVLERLQTYLDHECPDDVEAVVEAHLRLCPPCMDRADFERRIRAMVASRCRDAAPDGLVDAIKARLDLG